MAENKWSEEYAARGIFPNTYACVAISSLRDARKYAFDLLLSGAQVMVARDASDPKKYHVAVPGGMAGGALPWIVSVRGEAYDPQECVGHADDGGQHPIKLEVKED